VFSTPDLVVISRTRLETIWSMSRSPVTIVVSSSRRSASTASVPMMSSAS